MKSILPPGLLRAMCSVFIVMGWVQLVSAQAKSQGPYCGKVYQSSNANGGSLFWVNASHARCDEDESRTATDPIPQGQFTQSLEIYDFGFEIPQDAVIRGLEIVVIRRADRAESVHDRTVKLMRAGISSGQNKAAHVAWDKEWTAVYYGGSDALWGENWTPSDLNQAGFGVMLDVQGTELTGQPEIDEVLVTVHYSPAGLPAAKVQTSPSRFTCKSLGSAP